ncbi:membrane frizzled-related protein [Carettochelys insculpta]|uniref:membrane frizzled-related protein n=1 Tax=Carettochelys insculpta TaxID=44489 RepID=UPI003EC06B87
MKDFTEIALCPERLEQSKMEFCNPIFEPESEGAGCAPPAPHQHQTEGENRRGAASPWDGLGQPLWSRVGRKHRPDCKFSWLCMALMSTLLLLLIALLLGIVLSPEQQSWRSATPSSATASARHREEAATTPAGPAEPTATAPPRAPPRPATTPEPTCGGTLQGPEGSFSSPGYPVPYPPNTLCIWRIQVEEGLTIQLRIESLSMEGTRGCLFDRVELYEEQGADSGSPWGGTARFCGDVAPPTINTNSNGLRVTFVSDNSVGAPGFTAHFRAIAPSNRSCAWDEFFCDQGRCLHLAFVCDSFPDCTDKSDEANCSLTHNECGGSLTGLEGHFSTPNYPQPYPHQQLCLWQIAVPVGHVIDLRFHNFSLEPAADCTFDVVEVHDSAGVDAPSLLGRFCGSQLPPALTSSRHVMTVLFMADEGVADDGFFATYRARNATESKYLGLPRTFPASRVLLQLGGTAAPAELTPCALPRALHSRGFLASSERGITYSESSLALETCSPAEFSCPTGECQVLEVLCDGWHDCPGGSDEINCTGVLPPSIASSCQPIQVEMCLGLNYTTTSFPNIWLTIPDQQAAAAMLQDYKTLMGLSCYQHLRLLICSLFVPWCTPAGGVLQPCRAVCLTAQQRCQPALSLLSLDWPIKCDVLPDSSDPGECFKPGGGGRARGAR